MKYTKFKKLISALLCMTLLMVAPPMTAVRSSASFYDYTTGRTKTAYCYFCCADKTFYEHNIGYDGYNTCDGYVNGSSSYIYQCGTCGQSEGNRPTQLDSVWGIKASTSYHSIDLTWYGSNNATSYIISYGTSSSNLNKSTTSTTASVTISGLSDGTTYYFSIVATSTDIMYSNSNPATTSATTPVDITYVSPPAYTLTALSTSEIQVNWSARSYATSYTLQWSTKSSFSGATTETLTGTSYTISGLSANQTIYVRMRSNTTYSKYASAGYSSAKSLATLKIPLEEVSITSVKPSDATTLIVEFAEVENATGYIIEYTTDETFATKQTITV